MQLNLRRERYGSGNQKWLGSAHATTNAQTVTLDASKLEKFKKAGYVPSGTPLKAGASGKVEPVTEAADVLVGFLLTDQSFDGVGDVVAPMLDHGRVRVKFLPEGAFDVTTLAEAPANFVLVKEA